MIKFGRTKPKTSMISERILDMHSSPPSTPRSTACWRMGSSTASTRATASISVCPPSP